MDCRPLVDAGSFFVAVLWVSGIRATSRSLRTCSRTKQPTGSGSGDRYTTPRPPSSVGAAFSVAAIGMVHGIGPPAQASNCLQRRCLPECLVQRKTVAFVESLGGALLAAFRSRF
jgi:hypothetical protein